LNGTIEASSHARQILYRIVPQFAVCIEHNDNACCARLSEMADPGVEGIALSSSQRVVADHHFSPSLPGELACIIVAIVSHNDEPVGSCQLLSYVRDRCRDKGRFIMRGDQESDAWTTMSRLRALPPADRSGEHLQKECKDLD
jgi:hypothetical protein